MTVGMNGEQAKAWMRDLTEIHTNLDKMDNKAIKKGLFKVSGKAYTLDQLISKTRTLIYSPVDTKTRRQAAHILAKIGMRTKEVKYDGVSGKVQKFVDKVLNLVDFSIGDFKTNSSRAKSLLKDYAALSTDRWVYFSNDNKVGSALYHLTRMRGAGTRDGIQSTSKLHSSQMDLLKTKLEDIKKIPFRQAER